MNETGFKERVVELAKTLLPTVQNKQKAVSLLTNEKQTTVKNWVFGDRKPPSNKKIPIADSLGVSTGYLFDGQEFSHPVSVYDATTNGYRVPEIEEHQLTDNFHDTSQQMVVKGRSNINISNTILNNLEDVSKTYCFTSENIEFPPFVSKGDKIFINPTAKVMEGLFAIACDNDVTIVMVKKHGEDWAYFDHKNNRLEIVDKNKFMPIIMTISEGYK